VGKWGEESVDFKSKPGKAASMQAVLKTREGYQLRGTGPLPVYRNQVQLEGRVNLRQYTTLNLLSGEDGFIGGGVELFHMG